MGKRIMLMGVGAALGVGLGVIVASLGAGNIALFVGAGLGAVIPLLWLGQPSR